MTAQEFQNLIPTLRPQLVALATRYLKDSDEAEDIVQDAMLKLWLLRNQVIGNVEAFALAMVRNMALNRLRRQQRHQTVSDFEKMEAAMAEEQARADDEENVARLMSIVDSLPDRQKTVLRLHDMEGMDYEQIAELTGASVTALRQMVSRSRRLVRLRFLAVVSAVVAVVVAMTWGLRAVEDYRLQRRYEGSYVVVNGERNDNLREIRQQLELTLAQAKAIEAAVEEQAFVRQAEDDVLQSISDPDERRRLEELLKQ